MQGEDGDYNDDNCNNNNNNNNNQLAPRNRVLDFLVNQETPRL
jgi:hypothetical protein